MNLAANARTGKQRTEAMQACESLILRLWERRSAWPRGWPPAVAVRIAERLRLPEDDPDHLGLVRRNSDHGATGWIETFPLLVAIQAEERALWSDEALLEIDPGDIKGWLADADNAMNADERTVLESLLAGIEGAERRAVRRRGDPRVADEFNRRDQPDSVDSLEELREQRMALIERATGASRPATRSRESTTGTTKGGSRKPVRRL